MERVRPFPLRTMTVLALAALLVCLPAAREADTPASVIREDVMSSGGGPAAGIDFLVQDVIGESFAPGVAATGEFVESTGFIETLSASLDRPLDINADGAVGPEDTFTFAMGWQRAKGQPGYRERADIDRNLIINRHDLDRYLFLLGENR